MKQISFIFSQQDNRHVTDELQPIEPHSEVYLVNAQKGKQITMGQSYQSNPDKFGESYVE